MYVCACCVGRGRFRRVFFTMRTGNRVGGWFGLGWGESGGRSGIYTKYEITKRSRFYCEGFMINTNSKENIEKTLGFQLRCRSGVLILDPRHEAEKSIVGR